MGIESPVPEVTLMYMPTAACLVPATLVDPSGAGLDSVLLVVRAPKGSLSCFPMRCSASCEACHATCLPVVITKGICSLQPVICCAGVCLPGHVSPLWKAKRMLGGCKNRLYRLHPAEVSSHKLLTRLPRHNRLVLTCNDSCSTHPF